MQKSFLNKFIAPGYPFLWLAMICMSVGKLEPAVLFCFIAIFCAIRFGTIELRDAISLHLRGQKLVLDSVVLANTQNQTTNKLLVNFSEKIGVE